MGDFTKLAAWKKAHVLTLGIYRATQRWPRYELFGLTSQTRRAATSVPANVAEGCGRNSDAELARSVRTSLGEAGELSYYLILAHDLEYLATRERDTLQHDVTEVRRMLSSLERVARAAADEGPRRKATRRS